MTAITTLVALIGCTAVSVTRPIVGVVIYVWILCLYPQYLAVSLGSVSLSSGRIVIIALLIRILIRGLDPVLVRLRWMDLWVVVSFVSVALALFTTEAAHVVIEREGGHLVDTVLVYTVARLTLRTREDMQDLIRALVLVGLPLAVIGFYQSLTGHNPYGWMRAYSPFGIDAQEMLQRRGLYRADASFGNKISFGLFFALLIPLHASTAGRGGTVKFALIAIILFAGMVSAMSSAPFTAFIVAAAVMFLYPQRRFWPYVLVAFLVLCAVLEIASDRRFYYVLTSFALDSGTAYYRIKLIEEALGGGMSGRWLAGFGYVGPFQTGHNGFAWNYPDLANLYVWRLATTGLIGLIPYLTLNGYYYWCLYQAGRTADSAADKWTVWCLFAGLIGWNVAMMTVAALEQTNALLFMMIAVVGCSRIVYCAKPGAEGASEAPPAASSARWPVRPNPLR